MLNRLNDLLRGGQAPIAPGEGQGATPPSRQAQAASEATGHASTASRSNRAVAPQPASTAAAAGPSRGAQADAATEDDTVEHLIGSLNSFIRRTRVEGGYKAHAGEILRYLQNQSNRERIEGNEVLREALQDYIYNRLRGVLIQSVLVPPATYDEMSGYLDTILEQDTHFPNDHFPSQRVEVAWVREHALDHLLPDPRAAAAAVMAAASAEGRSDNSIPKFDREGFELSMSQDFDDTMVSLSPHIYDPSDEDFSVDSVKQCLNRYVSMLESMKPDLESIIPSRLTWEVGEGHSHTFDRQQWVREGRANLARENFNLEEGVKALEDLCTAVRRYETVRRD